MKLFYRIGLFGFIGLITPFLTHAAPTLLVTWRAHSYTPIEYAGKILPAAGASIDIVVAAIEGGRFVSLSPYEIRWYVNDELAARGVGRAALTLTAPRTGEDEIQIRVNLPNYKGQIIDEFISIPIVRPEAVIDRSQLPLLKPLFYFFNVADPSRIAAEWEENNDSLTLRASNKNNPLEFAQTSMVKR